MVIGIEATHANKEHRTGVEEYCFEIIRQLKKIIPADERVILYSNKQLKEDLSVLPANWSVKVMPWFLKKGWSQFRLSGHLFRQSPDIFFAPGQLVPFYCPKNTITTVHDSAFEVFPEAYSFAGRQYLKAMNKLLLNKSKYIITPSEFSRSELGRIYHFDLSRVQAIPLGYNHDFFRQLGMNAEEKQNFLDKYNIKKQFILSVGRLETKKNTANIIKAFDQIKKENDFELVLVGMPGRGFEKIKYAIEESPNKKDINLLGWVRNGDLPALYNLASVFIFASLYEGFGLPLLHAMASGCPAVASTGNSLEEVGGEAVLYAHPSSPEEIGNATQKIISDPALRADLIKKGLARSSYFSWENTANATWQTLRKAII